MIHLLESEGACVQAYDPQAMPAVSRNFPKLKLCGDPYAVATGADALVLATEWNEFKQIDFTQIYKLMRQPVIMDGRNLWDPAQLRALGLPYSSPGASRKKGRD